MTDVIDIPLNADVECTNGPGGQSTGLIVDPATLQVTHFVVREPKRPHTERLVPVEYVAETTPDTIHLRCSEKELVDLDPFVVTEYHQAEVPRYHVSQAQGAPTYASTESVAVKEEKEQVPEGEFALRQGTIVEATDGKVGQVDDLLVDSESGKITHFVLKEGHPWDKKDVLMPISTVAKVEAGTIYLKLDRQTIASMLAIPEKQRRNPADIELIMLIFSETERAGEALARLKKLVKKSEVTILNAAVLVKDTASKLSFKEIEDIDTKHGALFGAIAGGLIGLVGGPVGMVVGAAAGAATGGIAANKIDMGFPDDYLKKLQAGLEPGSSSLLILVERKWVDQVTEAMADYGGQLMRQALTDDTVARLTTGARAPDDEAETG
jgi:uncharacterized membrane protein/sporulation protein YlmC with PRC-barrel domain